METIKFSTKSTFFKIWHALSFFTDEENYPKDTCTLKRRGIYYFLWALITLPLFLIWQLVYFLFPNIKKLGLTGTIIHTLNLTCQFVGLSLFITKTSPILAYIFGGVTMGILITSTVFIGILIIVVSEKYQEYKKSQRIKKYGDIFIEKKPSILVTLYNGWKDKLCSKIEYVD